MHSKDTFGNTTQDSTTNIAINGGSTGATSLGTSVATTSNTDPRTSNKIEYLACGNENMRCLLTEATAAVAALDANSDLPSDLDVTKHSHSASAASTSAASTRFSPSELTEERSQILLPARNVNRAGTTSTSAYDSTSDASSTANQAHGNNQSDAQEGTHENAANSDGVGLGPNTRNHNRESVIVEDVDEDNGKNRTNPNYKREHVEIIQDLIENGDTLARKWAACLRDKRALIDNAVRVTCDKGNDAIEWTVCDDVKADTVPDHVNFNVTQGIKGFDFSNHTEQTGVKGISNKRVTLIHLLLHLWPGSLKNQLHQLNDLIKIHNETKSRGQRNKKQISKREYLKFLGILILARIEGVKGGHLWTDGDKSEGICKMKGIAKEHMTYTCY